MLARLHKPCLLSCGKYEDKTCSERVSPKVALLHVWDKLIIYKCLTKIQQRWTTWLFLSCITSGCVVFKQLRLLALSRNNLHQDIQMNKEHGDIWSCLSCLISVVWICGDKSKLFLKKFSKSTHLKCLQGLSRKRPRENTHLKRITCWCILKQDFCWKNAV